MKDSLHPLGRKKTLILTLIASVVVTLLFSYNIFEERKYETVALEGTHFAYLNGDAHSYFEPMESLIQTGVYQSNSDAAGYSRTGRTPHYGVFYWIARQFFEQLNALDAVIIFQLILRIISAVVFYRLALELTGRKNTAIIAYALFILMSAMSIHAYRFMTESLSVSFFIFGFWYFLKWKRSGKTVNLLLAGFFAGYLICMRPFMLPVIGVLVAANIFLPHLKQHFLPKLKNTVLFFVPLLLLLAPWMIRNYAITEKIIVFQEDVNAGYNYSPADISLRYFLTATGENFLAWDYDAAGCWFDPQLDRYSKYEIPETILCESVTVEKMELARTYYQDGILNHDTASTMRADSMFRAMREEFISERPFYYAVVAPLRILKRAYFHNGVELLQKGTPFEYAYKAFQGLLFVLICGAFAVAVFLPQCRIKGWLWIVPVMLAVVLCFGFRFSERRYFIYAYPVFVLYAALLFNQLAVKLKMLKQ